MTDGPKKLADLLQAMRSFLGQNDMMAYLAMMAPRMNELHRVLKPTGSIYLHCDPTASHYLKLLMDAVFGQRHFRNEIVWRYKKYQKADMHHFTRNSDRVLYYFRSESATYAPVFIPLKKPKHYLKREWNKATKRIVNAKDEFGHVQYITINQEKVDDVWELTYLMPAAHERLGYPTQKPEALLERIIQASSKEGDVVLDPFCGCGTAVAVAERLGRRWIGIDVTHLAISLMKSRLHDTFGTQLSEYDVVGVPQDLASARALAEESAHHGRYQFEYWALGLVDARPGNNRQMGADAGVDGYINFFDDESGKAKTVLVQVKSGHVQRNIIATLKGDMEREKAEMGLLVTLEPPTGPMEQEAAAAGLYVPEHFPDRQYPRVQIATIEDLLNGNGPDVPRLGLADAPTFRRAPRRRRSAGRSQQML